MKNFLDLLSLQMLRKIKIRYRLINSFVLVSLLPLLIAGVIAYRESSQASQETIRIFAGEVVKQVAQNMLQQMEIIETSSEELTVSQRMQHSLTAYYGKDEARRAHAQTELIRLLLERYGSFPYVNQKYLLDQHQRIIDAQVFAELDNDVAQFARAAPDLQGQPYWHLYHTADGQQSMVMLRDIRLKGNNKLAASLFIGLKPSHFSRIFEAVNLGYDSRLFVIDSNDGHIVIDADSAAAPHAGALQTEPDLIAAIARERAQASDDNNNNFVAYRDRNKQQQLASFAPIAHTAWMVVSTTPLNTLNAQVRSIRNKILLIGLLCFIGSFVLSFIIARSISLPLKKLVDVMHASQSGNFLIRMEQGGKDEIALLAQGFNSMASKVHAHNERLEELVAERTRALELANEQLAALSLTDSLTGIANRRRFDTSLSTELYRAARAQQTLGLLMLDVDFFKNYNDHYGHLAGDDCLRQVAQLLSAHTRRATDMAARYGGEEFAIILGDSSRSSAMQLAENIRSAIATLAIPHAAAPLGYVTCSIGVSVLPVDDNTTGAALLRMADAAMYLAKSRGRNQVVFNDLSSASKALAPAIASTHKPSNAHQEKLDGNEEWKTF